MAYEVDMADKAEVADEAFESYSVRYYYVFGRKLFCHWDSNPGGGSDVNCL